MTLAYLSLGGNIGDSQSYFHAAVRSLATAEACSVLAKSSLYRTTPWGKNGPAGFFECCGYFGYWIISFSIAVPVPGT